MAAESPHVFDQALRLVRLSPTDAVGALRWRCHTAAPYGNMVGPFGGITAAQALHALLAHPRLLGLPVALTVNFCAPIADGDFTIETMPARTNRTTQHWIITGTQGAEGAKAVVFTATAITATRRDTWGVTESAMPAALAPQSIARAGNIPAAAPAFLRRYDVRWITGAVPRNWDGAEAPDSTTRLWLRDDPPRPLDFESLTAACDFFYPRILLRRARWVPAGTVSLTIYYHADAAVLGRIGTGHLLGEARAQRYFDGYFDQTAALWSEAGELVATTHQAVYYKE